jgi:1-acyl-sn-glycerol-3-phosphate acyltransferase
MQSLGWALLNVFQAFFLGAWSVLWISLALVARIVTFGYRVPLWMARTFWGPGLLWVSGVKLDVRGLDHVDWRRTHVVAVNHQSMMDIPALFAALPGNLRFIAKRILSFVPFLGWYMWATGMIFVDRRKSAQAVETLRRAAGRSQEGACILSFPEGTRSRDGEILPFKKGPIMLALDAGLPVVPVAIEGARECLGADGFRVRPGVVKISVGRPIETAGLDPEARHALVERVRTEVIALRRAMLPSAAQPSDQIGTDAVEVALAASRAAAVPAPVPATAPAVVSGSARSGRHRFTPRPLSGISSAES